MKRPVWWGFVSGSMSPICTEMLTMHGAGCGVKKLRVHLIGAWYRTGLSRRERYGIHGTQPLLPLR